MAKRMSSSGVSACELPKSKMPSRRKAGRCAYYLHKGDFSWRGIRDKPYKADKGGWNGIIRRVLIGTRGESTKFHVRYFEIAPGGNSSLERHEHEHAVICVRGKGMVLAGKRRRRVGFMDIVYISPRAPHQLLNPFSEPFGFFCIVDAERDVPELL